MMAVFRVIVLIVLALNGLGSVSDGVGDRKEYVSTFLVSGALFWRPSLLRPFCKQQSKGRAVYEIANRHHQGADH